MGPVCVDGTPLLEGTAAFGGNAARGIGRYVGSVLRALASEQPEWSKEHLVLLLGAGADTSRWPMHTISTHRARWRPQDVGWWTAPLFDAASTRGLPIYGWHSTDPGAPVIPRRSVRRAVTVYDLIPLTDQRVARRMRPHRRLVYRLYLKTIRQADLVVAISRTTADAVHTLLGVPEERITVVYPALSPPPQRLISDAGVDAPAATDPDLLFVGVPEPHKNPEAAIAALAEIHRRGRNVRLRFVGPQPPADRRRLERVAAAAGVEDHVDYLGRVGDEVIVELYRQSVLLALSESEGLGLPPIEALMCGGRVVCGSAPAYGETLGNAVDRVDPHDPVAVADAYGRAVEIPMRDPPSDVTLRFSAATSAAASVAAYERLLATSE